MATVITNLISAIPWIGQDIVESKNITIIINLSFIAILFSVVAVYNHGATLLHVNFSSNLPTIGVIHQNALKKGNKVYLLR